MKITYASEAFPEENKFSIFLAGPTPRSADVESWRPSVINLLEQKGFNGNVFAPENRVLGSPYDFDTQIPWEVNGLNKASLIVFWIPRDLVSMPAFTTNIEYGEWMHSNKIVVGFPENSPNNRYIKKRCEMNGTPLFHNIDELTDFIIKQESK